MKGRELEKLIRTHLKPVLQSYQTHGELLYKAPPSPSLRGFYFAASRHQKSTFCVWTFVQPCYIPSDTLWFNMGKRLGTISGGAEKWWEIESPGMAGEVMQDILSFIKKEGLPYLEERDSLKDIVRVYKPLAKDPNGLLMEAVSGALVLLDRDKQATRLVDKLIASCHKYLDESPYLADTLARAEELKEMLLRNPVDAKIILQDRISKTLNNLGLG
jgi:hypothetical protein